MINVGMRQKNRMNGLWVYAQMAIESFGILPPSLKEATVQQDPSISQL